MKDDPVEFLIQFYSELSLLSALLISIVCLILKFQPYMSTNIASNPKRASIVWSRIEEKTFVKISNLNIFWLKLTMT